MNTIDNEIIIIGRDHYNALSVIRSLGENGIKTIFILVRKDEFFFASKSKYIKKCISIENENSIVEKLKDLKAAFKNKPIIIPTGDPIEKILDENYNYLSKYYYVPNIDGKQGEIINLMDKINQEKLCKKYSIKTPKSFLIDTNKFNINNNYPSKVIIKPYLSADGKKAHIIIAESKTEISNAIKKFKSLNYKKVLMQEFIDYDMEYAMMGISYKGKVIIPGINSNDYIYPSERGNTSYATMYPLEEFPYDIKNIIKMLEELNYTGLFEVEIFKKDKTIYFNEINFRNSANLLGYKGDNINYILIYIMLLLNKNIKNQKLKVTKKYHFCIETFHIKNVFEKRLNIFECIYHILISTKIIINFKDIKPLLHKIKNVFTK